MSPLASKSTGFDGEPVCSILEPTANTHPGSVVKKSLNGPAPIFPPSRLRVTMTNPNGSVRVLSESRLEEGATCKNYLQVRHIRRRQPQEDIYRIINNLPTSA